MHVVDAHDYGFVCQRREELLEFIKKGYFDLMQRKLLVYGVDGKLERYVTPKPGKWDARKAEGMLPPDEYRLDDEDVYAGPGRGLGSSTLHSVVPDEVTFGKPQEELKEEVNGTMTSNAIMLTEQSESPQQQAESP